MVSKCMYIVQVTWYEGVGMGRVGEGRVGMVVLCREEFLVGFLQTIS